MHVRKADPKVAMHVVTRGSGMGEPPGGAHPNTAIIAYDGHGEDHARSADGFAWAWDIPDVQQVQAGTMTVRQVNAMAETFRDWQGKNEFWLCAPLLDHVDEQTLERAWEWWEKAYHAYPGFEEGSTVILEFMQEAAYSSSPSRFATAFPHNARGHVMQVVLGCRPDKAPEDFRSTVMKLFQDCGPMIAGGADNNTGEFHPGFLHEWNDLRHIYGENYDRLRDVKNKYDPRNRFNKGVDLVRGRIGEGTTV